MVIKKYILANLRVIDAQYKKATNQMDTLLLSKMAILELCGWIEDTMDDIVMSISIRCLKENSNLKFVKDHVIKKTYGFEYKKHFSGMLMRVIGLVNVERVENAIDQSKRAKLEAVLSSLKTMCDTLAHTYIKGATQTVNAPSITITQLNDVYNGLIEIDRYLRKINF